MPATRRSAGTLLDRYDPDTVILVAGASPLMRPLQHQTWETFSVNWETDVRIAFHWLRETLLKPLRPGSRVIVISSGAAVAGSPAQRRVRRRQGQPSGSSPDTPTMSHGGRAWASRSPRCCHGSPR